MTVADYVAELVAFLIVIWFIARFVVPFLRRAAAQRQESIREQLEESRAAKQEAEQAEAEFNRAHEGLAAETARLRDDARTQYEQIVQELRERAGTDSARILQRGQDQLAAERETTVRQVRGDAGRLSVDLAELVVREFLRDESRRRASVGRALDAIAADGDGAAPGREAALTAGATRWELD